MLLLSSLLPACGPVVLSHEGKGIGRVEIEAASFSGRDGDPLYKACQDWSMTEADVRRFFSLSTPYEDNPYSEFYQLPCSISGRIEVDGQVWDYEINAGGVGKWTGKGKSRYWGCAAKECASLLLLPTDSMTGE